MIRFILSDRHLLLRDGIKAISKDKEDLSMVGEAANIVETKKLVYELIPDVILICSNVVDTTCELIELTSYSSSRSKGLILINTLDEILDTYEIDKMTTSGVSGFIAKDDGAEVLIKAIRTVAYGGTWLSKPILEKSIRRVKEISDEQPQSIILTNKEKKLLKLLAVGLSNADIAKELILAHQTVRNYISSIYVKLGVSSRPGAIIWARTHGFHER
jgi:DNA-binding NarL/FixJ family response regulator